MAKHNIEAAIYINGVSNEVAAQIHQRIRETLAELAPDWACLEWTESLKWSDENES